MSQSFPANGFCMGRGRLARRYFIIIVAGRDARAPNIAALSVVPDSYHYGAWPSTKNL